MSSCRQQLLFEVFGQFVLAIRKHEAICFAELKTSHSKIGCGVLNSLCHIRVSRNLRLDVDRQPCQGELAFEDRQKSVMSSLRIDESLFG